MEMSKRDRRALVMGGLALGVIAIYFYGIEPLLAWHDGLLAGHHEGAARISGIEEDRRKAERWTQIIEQREQDCGELVEPVEASEQITRLTQEIMDAAKKAGVELKESTCSSAVAWPDDPSLQRATFTIKAKVGWENTFKLVDALYHVSNVLSVESFELAKDPKKGNEMTVELQVSVLVKAPQTSETPWAS
jgi:hypothetical protein